MKSAVLVALAALVLPLSAALAANHDAHGAMNGAAHGSADSTLRADAAMADGVIKKVDKGGGKLIIAHGPLPNGMPAMTMAYRVKEAGWLEQLKVGERIRFSTDEGMTTIVRFERVK